jgi:glycosyltransferase involved in cell wall biosynthesis
VARIDASVAGITVPITWLLSGASADATPSGIDRAALRRAWRLPLDAPLGLYLGNHQAYRGLDALLLAAQSLDATSPPGAIVVAGPPRDGVPRHPRLIPIGHVSDVAGLLAAVDFVTNVNRFSLFDLSTIEALEAAKPLLLHAIGGNKTFEQLGGGIVALADLDHVTIAAGLCRMFSMSQPQRDRLASMSKTCYDAHLTRAHLWERHKTLYQRGECGPAPRSKGQACAASTPA